MRKFQQQSHTVNSKNNTSSHSVSHSQQDSSAALVSFLFGVVSAWMSLTIPKAVGVFLLLFSFFCFFITLSALYERIFGPA